MLTILPVKQVPIHPEGNHVNIRRTLLTMAGLVACATVTGACAVATPDPSQMALDYSGGPFSSQAFVECVSPGVRHVTWPNDTFDFYPIGQRTWDFTTKEGAEAPPIRIGTKNQTELFASGSVTLTWNDDCTPYKEYRPDATGRPVLVHEWPGGLAQRFHDTIGRHTHAFALDGGAPQPQGWNEVLGLYVGGPLQIAMNNASLNFTWEQLYNNPAAKADWQKQVEAQLQDLVDSKAGARHFIINQVQLGKPELPATLLAELENNQAANIRKTTADIDKATAANFPGGVTGLAAYQLQQAIAKAIAAGQVKVIPVPTGSIVSVPGS
jgi:SPFH domain/Band 7 family protein